MGISAHSQTQQFGPAKIVLEKVSGQELAQNGRFPVVPEEKFNSWPRGRQMAEICSQKAAGQDLAQNGDFSSFPYSAVE